MTYIRTYTGRCFDFAHPKVNIAEIAAGLAKTCRYGAQTHHFYSVAQHSVLLSQFTSRLSICPMATLLHDAAEAYLGDMVAPLKHESLIGDLYESHEFNIMNAVIETFGLTREDLDAVKPFDKRIRIDEMKALWPEEFQDEVPEPEGEGLGITIVPWSWEAAEAAFLDQFFAILKSRKAEEQYWKQVEKN